MVEIDPTPYIEGDGKITILYSLSDPHQIMQEINLGYYSFIRPHIHEYPQDIFTGNAVTFDFRGTQIEWERYEGHFMESFVFPPGSDFVLFWWDENGNNRTMLGADPGNFREIEIHGGIVSVANTGPRMDTFFSRKVGVNRTVMRPCLYDEMRKTMLLYEKPWLSQ